MSPEAPAELSNADHAIDSILPIGSAHMFDRAEKDRIRQFMDAGYGRNAAIIAGVEAEAIETPTLTAEELARRRADELADDRDSSGAFHRNSQ